MDTASEFKMDKSAFTVVSLTEADDELTYWLSKTPEERLRAVELIRQTLYGYANSNEGLQRVLTTARQERR
jgi:hypothetical protein